MQISIRRKLLLLCTLLVFLTSVGISVTYYRLSTQEKKLASQERIQIAFEIIFDDFNQRLQGHHRRFDEYFEQDDSLLMAMDLFSGDQSNSANLGTLRNLLFSQLNRLSSFASFDRMALYARDGRLLETYLPEPEEDVPAPDSPAFFPEHYEQTLPETFSSQFFTDGQQIGTRVLFPLKEEDVVLGMLIGDVLWTPEMFERFTHLSKTAINAFAGTRQTLGNLPAQSTLETDVAQHAPSCNSLMEVHQAVTISPVMVNGQAYYRSICRLNAGQETIGALTVNFSKAIEERAMTKVRNWVVMVSGLALAIGAVLSLLFSHGTIQSIYDIVRVIGAASDGDLRPVSIATSHDEIGRLAGHLDHMTGQLRNITGQVQQAASVIANSSDTILRQIDGLLLYMEQQSVSVEGTRASLETITQFIDVVSHNTSELLSASSQILASIRETRASISEVTTSTGTLSSDLQSITGSVEQVNRTISQVSEHTGKLEEAAAYTEQEIRQVEQSLQDVSTNADKAQYLANETTEAATQGQESAEASLQGMTELKNVISETADIIQEVNSWGEQVSSILGIVDDITEQTALLALNASIISAQAGSHGRGFAVVADEIKELATRTKSSTHEIGTLVRELQNKTAAGVSRIEVGIQKADQSLQLTNAVKEALGTILERATRSSSRASDTARVVQNTVTSGQAINSQISQVTDMVAVIKSALQQEEYEMSQVVTVVERIRDMAAQVNRANREQQRAAREIESSMGDVTIKFSDISGQTDTLQQEARDITEAMHTIESVTEQILQNATSISGDSVKALVRQSEVLQQIVNIFRVS